MKLTQSRNDAEKIDAMFASASLRLCVRSFRDSAAFVFLQFDCTQPGATPVVSAEFRRAMEEAAL